MSGNIGINMHLRQVAVLVPAGLEPIDGISHSGNIRNKDCIKMTVV